MALTLKCPHCGTILEITEALKSQLEDDILVEEKKKHRQELEKARSEATAKLSAELTFLKEEAVVKERKLAQAQQQELALRREKNKLEEEKRTFELTKQRQLDFERQEIRRKTIDELLEQQRLKEKEKDALIENLKKSLEDAQRKATQGSQQLQGEILELDLEATLKTAFPQDLIEPIAKGTLGADIRHTVKSPRGRNCGSILWESKRTKAWSDGWVAKLKSDMLADKATIAAIVTEALPEEAKKGIGDKSGVWMCSPLLAMPLAALLRKSILDAAREKAVSENKQTRAEAVYAYITGNEFRQQVEMLVETYQEMKEQITKERTAFEKSWKAREQQVNRVLTGISGVYGSMQGIAGSALPQIRRLELTDGE